MQTNPEDQMKSPVDPNQAPSQQEQSDPQLTELKGFIDPNEKLEPVEDKIDSENEKRKEED
jgi:hypothetical protein